MRAARCVTFVFLLEFPIVEKRRSRPKTAKSAPPAAAQAPLWLPRHRVAIPEPPSHYCDRPDLIRRCMPTQQRTTVLIAPGGFGKTTLLAQACRGAVAQRVPVAWVTLSSVDDPNALDAWLAYAFQEAGIDVLGTLNKGETPVDQTYLRTAVLIRALEARTHPCVLALDEAEHASDPAAVALLNHLFRNAPPCLHIAIACRELPPGLDLTLPVLSQPAAVLTAKELRFSKADIGRFFDLELSRDQLTAVAAESQGWPIALRIRRNDSDTPGTGKGHVARHIFDNWIAGRFWEGFSENDRQRVLDIGLLDWIDAALVEEVLEDTGAVERLLALPRLAGLLEPAGNSGAAVYRLHPLLREYCTERRRRENPQRFRHVHQRVASALARRGATLDAMRHASLAGDPALAGSVFIEAGALQLWLREGSDRLIDAARFLPADADEPRLAMARCLALLLQGRLRDAQRAFAAAPPRPNDPDLETDRLIVAGALAVNGCTPTREEDNRLMEAAGARIAERPGTSTLVRCILAYGRSVSYAYRTEFTGAIKLALRARETVVGQSAYLTMMFDSHLGQMAMVRGQVREAVRRYRSADRIAKAQFLDQPRLTMYAGLLLNELALERNRKQSNDDARLIAREVYRRGSHFAHYAAAADVAVALVLEADGTDAALSVVEDMGESARSAGLDLLHRHLGALRVSLLAEARDADAAQRAWHGSGLPPTEAECLALGAGGWRELEATACARILLLAAAGKPGEACHLAQALTNTAKERGLRRTLMRALALTVRLFHQAGNPGAAREATAEYVTLYARTDYARPLVRAGTAAARALDHFIDTNPDGPHAAAAERLLAMGRDRVPAKPRLTDRQKIILQRLTSQQDKQIADALGMTPHGVRYHIRAIFRKLGVHSRADAVQRARALGLFAPADD